MDASTRLYKRLGEIPEDPNDPESLDDLIVCAFGAFERYYVCWKTRGGDFRQGAHIPSGHGSKFCTNNAKMATTSLLHSETGFTLPTAQHEISHPSRLFSGEAKNTLHPTRTVN
jgi:hypothetical protein